MIKRVLFFNTKASIIDRKKALSQSYFWHLQRSFFKQQGVRAWNTGKVPHYATNNPYVAKAYGKVVFSFLRDWVSQKNLPLDLIQPVYIIELGTGSGRFAYHFLKQFFEFYANSALSHIPVKYVMTDLARQNLDFWRSHPKLQPYLKQGLLDFALFDVESDRTLNLIHSNQTLKSTVNPLVVVGNYFFDSIPQDLFCLEKGQVYETLVSVSSSEDNPNFNDANLLENLEITYNNSAITVSNYYQNPTWNQILKDYQSSIDSSYLLFPCRALECIDTLRQLSGDRLLLLAGDKGYTRLEDLQNRSRPNLAFHKGCFSLMVNFQAIAEYTKHQQGQALVPNYLPRSLNICGFLFGDNDYIETRQAYKLLIQQQSPDDFFTFKKAIEPHYDTLDLQQILAYLRFSGWDYRYLLGFFDNLMGRIETASDAWCQEIYRALHNVWETYYFIGEEQDLPFHLAMLFYKLGYYQDAIAFLDYSLQFYGEDPGMYYNQAMCYVRLESRELALQSLDRALTIQPQFTAAAELKTELETEYANK